ncbi:zinc finger RNA-binding protein-like protein [Sarcoptes scabiei]|uniref:Zinc finger RNA-binding protein-like protein n=1 Tax=Sarcoptes scabiei TaxID=52283 RepID=A0A131ZW63_SARSC|nr:zinc finger RNA-binding protein-like protein [Sarcoptes scabiei]
MPALKQSIVQSTAANLTTNPFVAPSYLAYSNAFVSNPPFPAPPLIPPSINLVSNMLGPFQSIPSSVVRQLPPNLPPSIPVPVTSTNYPMLANQFNYAQAYSGSKRKSSHQSEAEIDSRKNKKSRFEPKKETYCDVCDLNFSNESDLLQHLLGKQHNMKMELKTMAKLKEKKLLLGNFSTNSIEEDKNCDELETKITNAQNVMLYCKMCDIPCIGVDSYRNHITGNRHQRSSSSSSSSSLSERRGSNRARDDKVFQKELDQNNIPEIVSPNVPKALRSKIFKLFSQKGSVSKEKRIESNFNLLEFFLFEGSKQSLDDISSHDEEDDDDETDLTNVKPIGQDFIEEVLSHNGKLVCFTCTICECRFNDINAKNLHLKGRRHRLQYKKKVDPNYMIEFIKSDRIKLERLEKQTKLYNPYETNTIKIIDETEKIYSSDLNPFEIQEHSKIFSTIVNYGRNQSSNSQEKSRSFSDYLLQHKYDQLSPEKSDLEYFNDVTFLLEKAIRSIGKLIELNFLTTKFSTRESHFNRELIDFHQIQYLLENKHNLITESNSIIDFLRIVRSGPLGKGVLLKEERTFELIVLVSILPSKNLLRLFTKLLGSNIQDLLENNLKFVEPFEVQLEELIDEGMIKLILFPVSCANDPHKILTYEIYFTSPQISSDYSSGLEDQDTSALIDLDVCQQSLTKIRRFRWFKDKLANHACLMFIYRIIRDISRSEKVWNKLPSWNIEVILERIAVSMEQIEPSSLFRHFFEFLASGIALVIGFGLLDPCEKKIQNIFDSVSEKSNVYITWAAQHTLRMVALRKLDQVLSVDQKKVYKIRMEELETKKALQKQKLSNEECPKPSKKMKSQAEDSKNDVDDFCEENLYKN